ncbi:carboxypeptidase D-like [Branchiostoma lanceolatum]|uniref:carboxypeptidase D-like n=1 Tax=Branchiostoma lanceolatum TaxID=7740 RepID=UPI003456BD65
MMPKSRTTVSLLLLPLVLWLPCLPHILGQNVVPFEYHDYSQVTQVLREFHQNYSDITHLYSIGQSVQGRELWVIAISDNPTVHEVGEPEVQYVGNIHGNEVIGKELLLHLLEHLTGGYGKNGTISSYLNTTRVHILPAMNPDGLQGSLEGDCYSSIGRENARSYDLNRNFPDKFEVNTQPIQPETQAIMNWTRSIPFSLSAIFHGGAVVANYPWDNTPLGQNGPSIYSRSPDDDIYRHLALTYSENHGTMHQGDICSGDFFEDGISNGADWYPLRGGMQDWVYIHGECLTVTLEVSCCKYPTQDQLGDQWTQNKNSLIELLLQVHRGIKGQVFINGTGTPVSEATVTIGDRDNIFHTTSAGEFWRILIPGQYSVTVSKAGFSSETRTVIVPGNLTFSAVIEDFYLVENGTSSAPNASVTTTGYATETTDSEGRDARHLAGNGCRRQMIDSFVTLLNGAMIMLISMDCVL